MKRALVTGAHGFVASHLARALLERGDAVRVLDRPTRVSPTSAVRAAPASTCSGSATEVELAEADLRDAEAVAAAVARLRLGLPPRRADDRRRRPRVARRRPSRSTSAAPGTSSRPAARRGRPRSSSPPPTRPTAPARSCPTARTSRCAPPIPTTPARRRPTSIARSYAHAYGLPLAVTRFANVYGGGDLNFSRLIPETVVAVLDGRAPVIRSDGSPERDFLHVDDAVSAYLAIAERARRRRRAGERPSTPAASGRTRSREVVELIAAVGGTGVEPDFLGTGTPDGEIDRQYVDSTKLRELTGWRPEVELRDGLRRTLEWYRDHPEARPAKVCGLAMCGRFTVTAKDTKKIADRFQVELEKALERNAAGEAPPPTKERAKKAESALGRFNVAPTPGGPDGPLLARPRGGGAGRARGAADALGPGAALGQGPQGRLQDDQRQSREPHLEPRLLAAGRQVPPPLPDRRRRLLRVDEGRGPQAAAPALALHGRRRRALRLRRASAPARSGRTRRTAASTTAGSTAARS